MEEQPENIYSVIGLANKTGEEIKFTSKRLLMERVQEVPANSVAFVDWAYKNLGLFSATGKPNVTVSWSSNSVFLDGGQILIVKSDGSFEVDDFDEGNTEQQGAFDKDGWATKLAEGIPGVGYVASAVHAAKGNTEQAKRAMGRCTNSTLVTTGGILAAGLGPLGVFAGVAAGSVAGQMTERGVNEFVEEEARSGLGTFGDIKKNPVREMAKTAGYTVVQGGLGVFGASGVFEGALGMDAVGGIAENALTGPGVVEWTGEQIAGEIIALPNTIAGLPIEQAGDFAVDGAVDRPASVIGLANKTGEDIKFTSKRLLMERLQV